MLKGVIAVLLCFSFLGKNITLLGLGGLAAMVGHNYPIWLRFKGGRGLSTAAGIMYVLGWMFIVIWCSFWATIYLTAKNIHLSNVVASVVSPLAIVFIPEVFLKPTLPSYSGKMEFFYISLVICLLILLRHTQFIKESFKSLSKRS